MLKRISDVFYKIIYYLSAVGFGALIILLFVQIIARNILKFTFANVDEFTKFLFVWLMYLEISLAVRDERHIKIDFLFDKFSGSFKKLMEIVIVLLTIVFFVVIAVFGTQYGMSTMIMTSPILRWSMGIMYLCIPAGCAMSVLFSIEKLMKLLTGKEEK